MRQDGKNTGKKLFFPLFSFFLSLVFERDYTVFIVSCTMLEYWENAGFLGFDEDK